MVTFTTLAESKCREPLSEHVSPTAGASTAIATEETRPRRAAWMSPLILAASAGCDEERLRRQRLQEAAQEGDRAEQQRPGFGIADAGARSAGAAPRARCGPAAGAGAASGRGAPPRRPGARHGRAERGGRLCLDDRPHQGRLRRGRIW